MADRVVSYSFRANFGQFQSGLAAMGRGVNDLGVKLTALDRNGAQMRHGLDEIGRTSGRVGLVAAAGLGAVSKAAIDWESAWTGVMKTVDGTPAQLAKVETGLRQLAKTLPSSHDEIAAVAEAAGQLGVHTEDIVSFTKTMIDLGQTTNLSAEDAATAIAQMANVMGTAPDQIDNLGSALVALGNNGASTERQIVEMAQRIAGAGAQVGLTEANVLGLANAAASMGIEVEAGGTAISTIFTKMAVASKQGGDKLELFAQTSGKTADQFAEDFGRAPAETFASFVGGLDQIKKSGGDVFTTLKNLGLSDIRVSQALLGMAASGDLLTDSLKQGNEAWEKNTALAAEAEKRYDTSASQIRVSINRIEDSAIEFGEVALPVIAKGAEVAGVFGDVLGSLPGPIKQTATAMLAVTALTGGGLWFGSKVIGGVVSTKSALRDLNITLRATDGGLTRTGKSLRGLAIGGGVLVGLAALDGALDSIDHHDIGPTVNELTNALNDLAAAKVGALPKGFRDLGESMDLVESKSSGAVAGVEKLLSPLTKLSESISGSLGFDDRSVATKIEDAQRDIETIDQALSRMVDNDGPTKAAEAFNALAKAQGLSSDEQTRLMAHLPEYRDAIAGSADATGSLTDATGALGASAGGASEDINKLVEAMQKQRDAAVSGFDAETNYRRALKDAQDQAAKNNAGIRGNGEAALENRDKLTALAAAWNNQSDAVRNNEKRFRQARKAFIDTATAMGVPIQQARRLARQFLELPDSKVIPVTANTTQADAAISRVRTGLASLKDKNINVSVSTLHQATNGGIEKADGGPIYGPGTATSDSIPAMLSDGEFVVRAAAVEKYGLGFFAAANKMQLAGGGAPGGLGSYVRNDLDLKFPSTLKQWNAALATSTKLLEKEQDKRKAIVDSYNDVRSAIGSNYRSDLFGSRGGDQTWLTADQRFAASGTAAFGAGLSSDIANLNSLNTAIAALKSKGFDGPALAEVLSRGSLTDVQSFANSSKATLNRLEVQFNERDRLLSLVGSAGGRASFGSELAAQTKETRHIAELNRELIHKVAAVEKAIRHHGAQGKASRRSAGASVRTRKRDT